MDIQTISCHLILRYFYNSLLKKRKARGVAIAPAITNFTTPTTVSKPITRPPRIAEEINPANV